MKYEVKLLEGIKNYLLECMGDTEEEAVHEIRRYRSEFHLYDGYNIYVYGNILPYYHDMRRFCEEDCGVKMNEDNFLMQKTFERYICRAVDDILAMDKYRNIK